MAQAIKDRDNPNMIGMVTGKVISPPPSLAVSIMEGQIVIKNAYIADYLLKGYTRRVNIKTAAAEGSTNSASCSDGSTAIKSLRQAYPIRTWQHWMSLRPAIPSLFILLTIRIILYLAKL